MHKLTLLLFLAVAACGPTPQEAFNRNASEWLGQPVRSFAEAKGLSPVSVNDRPGGKAFVYQVMVAGSTCGVTVIGEMPAGAQEWLISGIYSPCDGVSVRRY